MPRAPADPAEEVQRRSRDGKQMTLAGSAYLFTFGTLLLIGIASAVVVSARSVGLVDSTLDAAVRSRTQAASELFGRMLQEEWHDVTYLAERIGAASPEQVEELLRGMRGDGSQVSWVGYADVQGEVRAATDDILVGDSVAQRPWFRNGLKGSFAGDLHEADQLADLLQPEAEEPLRFVDLASPVTDAAGEVKGVVGTYIDSAWVEKELRETGRMLRLDLYLINPNGRVVMGPEGSNPGREELEILGAARTGASASGRETWPDGHDYFAALVPSVSYGDLPSFGWRMAGRIRADIYRPGMQHLQGTVISALVVAAILLAATTMVYVRAVLRPISRMAETAQKISEGVDVYPPEAHSTEEAGVFSVALVKLQAMIMPGQRWR